MPEGDTIYTAAGKLRPALVGRTIVAASGSRRFLDSRRLINRTVEKVQAQGKHLLFHLSRELVVHSHMGMTGAWHIYAAGQPWFKPMRQAALTLRTDLERTVVCFTPKQLEIVSATELRRDAWMCRLGPDLLDQEFHAAHEHDIVRRFRILNNWAIGEAILSQSVVCGIGNVYKSEVLFLQQIDPFSRVCEISDERLRSLIRLARRLMRRNLEGRPRRTRFGMNGTGGPRMWVYGRSHESCLKCETTIQMRRQGDLGRSTYYCPRCQRGSPVETFR